METEFETGQEGGLLRLAQWVGRTTQRQPALPHGRPASLSRFELLSPPSALSTSSQHFATPSQLKTMDGGRCRWRRPKLAFSGRAGDKFTDRQGPPRPFPHRFLGIAPLPRRFFHRPTNPYPLSTRILPPLRSSASFLLRNQKTISKSLHSIPPLTKTMNDPGPVAGNSTKYSRGTADQGVLQATIHRQLGGQQKPAQDGRSSVNLDRNYPCRVAQFNRDR